MGPVSVAASHQRAALRPAPSASTAPALPALRSPRLLDRLRERIRWLHYSRSTEQAYVYGCRSFIRFHNLRHPMDMAGPEVEASPLSLPRRRHRHAMPNKVLRRPPQMLVPPHHHRQPAAGDGQAGAQGHQFAAGQFFGDGVA